jgi:hypothetical protein
MAVAGQVYFFTYGPQTRSGRGGERKILALVGRRTSSLRFAVIPRFLVRTEE